ncbi:phosphatidylserine decarboxylase [Thecaphora frezii]
MTATPTTEARPLCRLRVQILSARSLTAKDRNGKSDPFVVVSLPGTAESSHRTAVKSKTLDPVWKDKEATFEYDMLPGWFGPHLSTVAAEELNPDVVKALLAEVTATTDSSTATSSQDAAPSAKGLRSRRMISSASARRLGGAATKILAAPVKFGAAGAKVVGRGVPRPMRMKRRLSGLPVAGRATSGHSVDTIVVAGDMLAGKPPRGSIQLDATNATVSALEFVLWDKDRFSGNDYLGECSLLVREWCPSGKADWAHAEPMWLPVTSSRPDTNSSGEVQVRIGFVEIPSTEHSGGGSGPATDPYSWPLDQIYQKLTLASLGSEASAVRAVPAAQSVGTAGPTEDFLDDGLSSSSEDEEEDDDDLSDTTVSDLEDDELDTSSSENEHIYDEHYASIAGVPATAEAGPQAPESTSAAPVAPPQQPGRYRRIFSRRKTGDASKSSSGASTPSPCAIPGVTTTPAGDEAGGNQRQIGKARGVRGVRGVRRVGKKRTKHLALSGPDELTRKDRRRSARGRRSRQEYSFKAEMGMDIIGIVMMEVKRASDLPRWKNMTHTSFDMDPFTIVSFGQKVFRTKVARHTLDPVWNEKLLFHVRRHEANFQAKFLIYDWDKISSNDYVGGASINVAELIESAPKPNPATGLYDATEDGFQSMKEFRLPLTRLEKDEVVKFKGTKQAPSLLIEAKFTPYDSLRQRFWRQLALQYDTNDSNTLSQLELTSMLDSLGSTLTTRTIEGFFHARGKNPEDDELTFDEVVRALEDEIKKPWAQKRRASSAGIESGAQTPGSLGPVAHVGAETNRDLDMSGSNAPTDRDGARDDYFSSNAGGKPESPVPPSVQSAVDGITSEPTSKRVPELTPPRPQARGPQKIERGLSALSLSSAASSASSAGQRSPNPALSTSPGRGYADAQAASPPILTVDGNAPISEEDANSVERVIRLKSCPLCHMPRLSKKGEVDIVTHLAVCASQDWRRVDSLAVTNFVTASQAHRKWYTRVVNKISQGNYSLGANSANIIVQDRRSGELMEEKMQVYVRLGIRLLYKGARSRMEGARVKKMLKNMSIKQGVKFDSPTSAREIAPFIAFHNLDLDEVLDPLESFKTFNEFFYRKLKPDARPNDEPDNTRRLVSGADCRMMAFETVDEATRIWIKGRDFTVARLLGGAADKVASLEAYQNGGSVAIFRLAPQDYHRFHCPADATVGEFTWIEGQYYTVNPMAIRSAIDVYGENIRVVVPFHSAEFGTFYAVCIGAMMVGSTVLTVKEGDRVRRGQEFGYFKFGGSTIVLVFERGRMEFDDDILENSRAAIETLVRVGMGIGRAVEPPPA